MMWLLFCAMAMAKPGLTPHPNPLSLQSLQSESSEVQLGTSTTMILRWQLAAGYHAYLDQFHIEVTQPEGLRSSLQEILPTEDFFDKFSKKNRQGVKGEGQIRFVVDLPLSADLIDYSLPLEVSLTYQACSNDFCLFPKTVKMTSHLQVDQKKQHELFNLTKQSGTPWFTVFLAGLLTSLTPCIFPLIPITLTVLGARQKHPTRMAGFFLSLAYVMGIALTYSLLGLLAASTGTLFGSFLGHPIVSLLLAILFACLALSMLDLFPLQTPGFLSHRLLLHKTQGGGWGAFLAGTVAGLVASPCVGPVLTAILTYVAKTQNLARGFSLLFVFALGMGQPFLLLGTFSGLQKYWPKSGPWMKGIKYIFSLTFFGLALFYLQPWLQKNAWWTNLKSTSEIHPSSFWQNYSDNLLAQARAEKKPVVIDFFADWCVACKEMEKFTLHQPLIQAFSRQILFVRFDATHDSSLFKELQKQFGIMGLPHFVFLDAKGQERKDLVLTGFENVQDFSKRIQDLLKAQDTPPSNQKK